MAPSPSPPRPPIPKALRDAHKPGVAVTVILDLDKSQRTERYRSADFLADAGIPTYIDAQHAIAHNKVMLIDGTTLVIGSFNFTGGAPGEKRGEGAGPARYQQLLQRYRENIEVTQKHS